MELAWSTGGKVFLFCFVLFYHHLNAFVSFLVLIQECCRNSVVAVHFSVANCKNNLSDMLWGGEEVERGGGGESVGNLTDHD